jgi:hypothetical protein
MKSKWESPTAQKLICAFGDSHLFARPGRQGVEVSALIALVALVGPSPGREQRPGREIKDPPS